MNVRILNAEGKEVGTHTVLAAWEHRRVVPSLLQQAVVAAAANARIPRAHTKGRGEVRGGGRKPWKQKGTGRSRHGSIRSPLWKGGGVTFGPTNEQNFTKRFPASMRRTALAMALVAKVRDAEITMTEAFPDTTRTKELSAFVQILGLQGSILLLVPDNRRAALARAGRNLPRTVVADPRTLNAAGVLQFRHVVATPESWATLEARLQKPASKASEASEAHT
jgi:large subunit ribosomal protein L4